MKVRTYMNEFEFKKMHIKNEVLAYREGGTGNRNLLLIHGNMSSSAHFDHLMDALRYSMKDIQWQISLLHYRILFD